MSELFTENDPDPEVTAFLAETKKELSHGAKANQAGQVFEDAVEFFAKRFGVSVVDYKDDKGNLSFIAGLKLVKRVPYTNMYTLIGYSEFVLYNQQSGRTARIECRWQSTSGSVDEKFPYLFENAKMHMPEKEIVLLVDGDGAKDEAVAWLKDRAKNFADKTIHVLTLGQFLAWFKRFIEEAGA